jgi:hypothetical protein
MAAFYQWKVSEKYLHKGIFRKTEAKFYHGGTESTDLPGRQAAKSQRFFVLLGVLHASVVAFYHNGANSERQRTGNYF